MATQTLSTAPLSTIYDFAPDPAPEVLSYSKAVQTSESWTSRTRDSGAGISESDGETSPGGSRTPKARKRFSKREKERDEELRSKLRKEIEAELKATRDLAAEGPTSPMRKSNFPARGLTDEELNAVTSSEDFLDFVERSSKVIERALDDEYDILTDYTSGRLQAEDDEEDDYGVGRAKKKKGIKEVAQFWNERWSKKRMVSDISFSPKVLCSVCNNFLYHPNIS